MSTGHCREDDQANPWYVPLTCGNYSAREDAEWYLNMDEKEELTKRVFSHGIGIVYEITEADVKTFKSGRNCPVMGLFRAGTIQRKETTGIKEETYDIDLAYDKSIYEGSPEGVTPKINAYGLVTVKPKPPSDICTSMDDQDYYYDRRVPCKAHDYCWDLVRFTVAPGLSEDDCDARFKELMYSDCADRGNLKGKCRRWAEIWELAVSTRDNVWIFDNLEDEIAPGVVMIQNVETGMCVDVEGSSEEDGARLIQWPCEDNGHISENRMFRFHKTKLRDNWYFDIQPEHQPDNCISVATDNDIKIRKPSKPTGRQRGLTPPYAR